MKNYVKLGVVIEWKILRALRSFYSDDASGFFKLGDNRRYMFKSKQVIQVFKWVKTIFHFLAFGRPVGQEEFVLGARPPAPTPGTSIVVFAKKIVANGQCRILKNVSQVKQNNNQ